MQATCLGSRHALGQDMPWVTTRQVRASNERRISRTMVAPEPRVHAGQAIAAHDARALIWKVERLRCPISHSVAVTSPATKGTIDRMESNTPRTRIWVAETSRNSIWKKRYMNASHPGIVQARPLCGSNSGAAQKKGAAESAPPTDKLMVEHPSGRA